MSPIDVDKLRLSSKATKQESSSGPQEKRVPRKTQKGRFLKGPVPLNWLMWAAKQPGKSLHVGIALWFKSGLTRSHRVSVPNGLLNMFGVDRHAKARALRSLESAGLISVKRESGKNPVITILPIDR
jgi:hypothetical protein